MKELKDLISVVQSRRVGRIETLSNLKDDRNKIYHKLYKGVADGTMETEEDAIRLLYDGKTESFKFNMLKKRLKERLYTTLLFLEPRRKSAKSYLQNSFYCYKHFVVAKLLLIITLNETGRKLMLKVLKRATEYNIFDIAELCALNLRREYMVAGEVNKFQYYNKLFLHIHEIVAAEAKAEELYYRILVHFSKSIAYQPQWAAEAQEFIKEIKMIKEKFNTYQLNYNDFNIQVAYYQLVNDYQAGIKVCEEYEKYLLKNQQFYSDVRYANVLLIKMNCYLHVRNLTEGKKCAEKALAFYNPGTENWFILQELYFLLTLNMGNYEKAGEIYLQVTEHDRFERIRPRQQEVWKIFGGYLWFLLRYANKQALFKEIFQKNTVFRLSKLLNEVPIFSRDKKGFNVAVLILQILILIQEEEFPSVISRMEALQNYMYKNLRNDEASRSHIFIKMLLSLEKRDFDPVKIRAKTKNIYGKLQQEGVKYEVTQARMEILPYEEIWQIILDMLNKNKQSIYTS